MFSKLLSYSLFLSLSLSFSFAQADSAGLIQQCVACHGAKAEGNQAMKAPALAGQAAWYIENQLNSFIDGHRGSADGDSSGATMAAIAKGIKASKINNIADYLENLPKNKQVASFEGDVIKGKQLYDTLCGSCHGPNGKGNKALNAPILAGLNDWYIVEQIGKFRAGHRGYNNEDRLGRQMRMMAAILPDEQALKDVALYLSQQ